MHLYMGVFVMHDFPSNIIKFPALSYMKILVIHSSIIGARWSRLHYANFCFRMPRKRIDIGICRHRASAFECHKQAACSFQFSITAKTLVACVYVCVCVC
jgi:hypothetical protein